MRTVPASTPSGVICLAAASVAVLAALAFTPAYGLSSTLVLDPIPDQAHTGDKMAFTGTLAGGGSALPGRTVWICEDDPLWPDECFAIGTTDGAGRFHIEWTVRDSAVETDFDIYAKFNGDSRYDSDQTLRQEMSVYELRGGRLTLDPVQDSAWFGEVVEMSGTLYLEGRSPEGSLVYIKDEDTFNPDDLLATAHVDASGRFTTYWIAQDVDPTNTIEIQAVFEKDSTHRRLATNIQKLAMNELPRPVFTPVGGDGYIELYYSFSFDRAPRVLIVSSPESYDSVRKHITPVREGISLLTSMLEREYPNGDWSVDVEVVEPGDRAGFEPDIFVNLVTRDDDAQCRDVYGYANLTGMRPVQTVVCSLYRPDAAITGTALHEFIHAMGVGHTFNIPNDRLCSVEPGYGDTCPGTYSKSDLPSELNLAAVAAVYGTDGFQNPNNHITYKERFTLNDRQSGGLVASQPGGGVADDQLPTVIFTDLDRYKEGEVILVDGIYTGEHEEYLTLYLTDQYNDVVGTVPVSTGVIIEEFFFGFHPAGTYTVWLYDEHDWVEGNSFEISGVDDAVIYADEIWYSPGDPVYLDGFYWGSYNGWSELFVLDPFGDAVEWVDVAVVDDFFGVYLDGYHTLGRYLVLLYDDSDNLAASTAFHVSSEP